MPPSAQAYHFLTRDDAIFIEAAVGCLIPADEHGPGAHDIGAAVFIDRCLQGAWNSTDRLYRSRFWQAGRRVGDYVLPATPGSLFRSALNGIENDLAPRRELQNIALCGSGMDRNAARSRFARLPASAQHAYLHGLQTDVRPLDGVPSWLFLELLFCLTVEAFFADPAFSGNEDTVALSARLRILTL